MRERLQQLIQNHETPAQRLSDFLIQLLINCLLITFSIETIPGLSERQR